MRMVGDVYGMTAASAGHCLHATSSALCANVDKFIKWPSDNEITLSKRMFHDSTDGIPCVMGAIDGTHVPLNAPRTPFHESAFVNRKSYHSINCQILCDSQFKIYDIDCRWPGSSHDSFILRQSTVFQKFDSNAMGDTLILGDSGYALSKWLMVPFSNPSSLPEERFNIAHKKGRCVVERCNGLLKMRWRCLTKPLMFQPAKSSRIIGACAALHNFAIMNNIPFVDEIDRDLLEQSDMQEHSLQSLNSSDGAAMRREIVRRFFS